MAVMSWSRFSRRKGYGCITVRHLDGKNEAPPRPSRGEGEGTPKGPFFLNEELGTKRSGLTDRREVMWNEELGIDSRERVFANFEF